MTHIQFHTVGGRGMQKSGGLSKSAPNALGIVNENSEV